MKTYIIPMLLLSALCCEKPATAQEQLPRTDKHPVLIDDVNGQRLPGKTGVLKCYNLTLTDLSEKQEQQVQQLIMDGLYRTIELNNKLAERQAHQRTLEAKDKVDMKAVYQVIDEQAKLLAEKLKADADCKQKIRSVLNNEQRVTFDASAR